MNLRTEIAIHEYQMTVLKFKAFLESYGRLFVAFLGLFSITWAVSAMEQSPSLIQKSTGRIIFVTQEGDYLHITNNCSATLIAPNRILTAGHCFEMRSLLKTQTPSNTKMFFDIDGVTSKNLSQSIRSYMDENSPLINGRNKRRAQKILNRLPEITSYKLHPTYSQNMPVMLDEYRLKTLSEPTLETELQNYKIEAVQYDLAIATLSREVLTTPVSIASYQEGEDIYISGYPGGPLDGTLETYKCITGELALDGALYAADVEHMDIKTVLNNLRVSTSAEAQMIQKELERKETLLNAAKDLLKSSVSSAILAECPNGKIIKGFSGGPHFVLRNNQPYLVGVSSTVPRVSVKYGEIMIGSRSEHAQDIK